MRQKTIVQKKVVRKCILSETSKSCNVGAVNVYACKEVISVVCCRLGVIVLFPY
jgi:hypothetical protein